MSAAFILAVVLLCWGFFVAGRCWDSIRPRSGSHVRVESSSQLHHVAVVARGRIGLRPGKIIAWERVDVLADDFDERLVTTIAQMKQRLRTIDAAKRIASE